MRPDSAVSLLRQTNLNTQVNTQKPHLKRTSNGHERVNIEVVICFLAKRLDAKTRDGFRVGRLGVGP